MAPSKIPIPVSTTNGTVTSKRAGKLYTTAEFRLRVPLPMLVAEMDPPTIREERAKELIVACQNLMRRYFKFTITRNGTGKNDAEWHAQAIKQINDVLKDVPDRVDEQPSFDDVNDNKNNTNNDDDDEPVVKSDATAAIATTTTASASASADITNPAANTLNTTTIPTPVVNNATTTDPSGPNPADNVEAVDPKTITRTITKPNPNPITSTSTSTSTSTTSTSTNPAPPLAPAHNTTDLPLLVPDPAAAAATAAAVVYPMSINIIHSRPYRARLLIDEFTAFELDVRKGGPSTIRYDPTSDAVFPAAEDEDEARDRDVPEGMYF